MSRRKVIPVESGLFLLNYLYIIHADMPPLNT